MPTEVLTELWNIKDSIAKEHRYDLDELAEYFRKRQAGKSKDSVQQASNITAEQDAPVAPSAAAFFSE